MSIKFKLWIQAFIPILCVTIIGGFSILLTTISQQEKLIEENLEANIKQLEKEVEVAVIQLEQTLEVQVKKRDFIRSVRSLYQIKNTFPVLKKSFQCKAITLIRELTFKKGYDLVALYNQEGIESYATKDNIYVASIEQPGSTAKHFSPSTGPFLKQCSSNEWTQVADPIRSLPEKLDISSDPSIYFSVADGQLNLIGVFPVKVVVYANGEEKINQIGTIYLRKNFSNKFIKGFAGKTSIASDIFSTKGEHLVGNYFNQVGKLPIDVNRQVNKGGLAEINIDDRDYFIKLRPYSQNSQPVFLMAAYSPKATVSENSKKLLFLEAIGLLAGLVFAALVAIFMGRLISRPLNKLKYATLKIGQGELDTEIDIYSKDEFGMLARSLSKMAKDLSLITVSRNYVDDILKTMDDCLVVISSDNLIQTVNRATCELLGYKEADLIGKEIGIISVEETHEGLLDFYASLEKLKAKGTFVNLEFNILAKNNKKLPIQFSGSVMRDNEGKTVGTVVTFMDISERIKNENLLKQYSIELENNNKELSSFASITSHDLKNPIRKIANFCSIIEEEDTQLSEKTKQYLSKIELAANHSKNLIEGILEYSQLGQDKVAYNLIDLNETVSEIIENLEFELLETKGKVEWGHLPSIFGSELQIRQLFENLISNSLKYRKNDVSPIIKISHHETNQDHVQIILEDNGSGFDNIYAKKIFDPFQRLDGDISTLGSGLGLSICKKIMLGHLGEITAEGEVNRGAKFVITFPLKD